MCILFFFSLWSANPLLFTLYYRNDLCHFWIGVQVAAVTLQQFLDIPQTYWGEAQFSNSMTFFKFYLFCRREIFCHRWQLDKKRLQSHFCLSIFLLGSIMNKQCFRWLTSKKCFLSNSCQDFGTQGKTSFQLWFLNFEVWITIFSKVFLFVCLFHNLNLGRKGSSIPFCVYGGQPPCQWYLCIDGLCQ